MNNSDEALTDLEGALSSDVQRPDLLLDVVVEAEGKEPSARGPVATVPPGEPFRLTFLFPPESTGSADGISVDESSNRMADCCSSFAMTRTARSDR